jgi:membrane-associated phospholipid phosphatase
MTRIHRPLPSTTVLLVLIILGLVIGIGLGIVARGTNVLAWDVEVTTAFQNAQGPVVDNVAEAGHKLGSTLLASIAIGISLLIALLLRARREIVFLASLLVLRLAGTQFKPIFDSPRPTSDLVGIVGEWNGMGYPSGHAMTAATMSLGLCVIAWQRIPSRPLTVVSITVLIMLGLLIGWARIWTGAHWASDVVGGYSFGLVITSASVLVLKRYLATPAPSARRASPTSMIPGD